MLSNQVRQTKISRKPWSAPSIKARILRFSPPYFSISARTNILPNVVIIGSQRSGSSSLHKYLSQHPQMVPPVLKEVHYFDLNYHRKNEWYRKHFCTQKYVTGPNGENLPRYAFETTPYYLFHPAVPQRAAKTLPANTKYIAILRNPVERAFSHYQLEHRKGLEPLTFEEAIYAEESRLAGEQQRLMNEPDYYSFEHHHHSYVERGRYDLQIEHWLNHINRNQLLILQAEDLFANPQATSERVFEFIGISKNVDIEYDVVNAGGHKSKIKPYLHQHLSNILAPHAERLADITGQIFDWKL